MRSRMYTIKLSDSRYALERMYSLIKDAKREISLNYTRNIYSQDQNDPMFPLNRIFAYNYKQLNKINTQFRDVIISLIEQIERNNIHPYLWGRSGKDEEILMDLSNHIQELKEKSRKIRDQISNLGKKIKEIVRNYSLESVSSSKNTNYDSNAEEIKSIERPANNILLNRRRNRPNNELFNHKSPSINNIDIESSNNSNQFVYHKQNQILEQIRIDKQSKLSLNSSNWRASNLGIDSILIDDEDFIEFEPINSENVNCNINSFEENSQNDKNLH